MVVVVLLPGRWLLTMRGAWRAASVMKGGGLARSISRLALMKAHPAPFVPLQWIKNWREKQAGGSAGAGASGVSANVQEAREWIARWRSRQGK